MLLDFYPFLVFADMKQLNIMLLFPCSSLRTVNMLNGELGQSQTKNERKVTVITINRNTERKIEAETTCK